MPWSGPRNGKKTTKKEKKRKHFQHPGGFSVFFPTSWWEVTTALTSLSTFIGPIWYFIQGKSCRDTLIFHLVSYRWHGSMSTPVWPSAPEDSALIRLISALSDGDEPRSKSTAAPTPFLGFLDLIAACSCTWIGDCFLNARHPFRPQTLRVQGCIYFAHWRVPNTLYNSSPLVATQSICLPSFLPSFLSLICIHTHLYF